MITNIGHFKQVILQGKMDVKIQVEINLNGWTKSKLQYTPKKIYHIHHHNIFYFCGVILVLFILCALEC